MTCKSPHHDSSSPAVIDVFFLEHDTEGLHLPLHKRTVLVVYPRTHTPFQLPILAWIVGCYFNACLRFCSLAMYAQPPIKGSQPNEVLSVSFNSNASHFTLGLDSGYAGKYRRPTYLVMDNTVVLFTDYFPSSICDRIMLTRFDQELVFLLYPRRFPLDTLTIPHQLDSFAYKSPIQSRPPMSHRPCGNDGPE